MKFKFGAKKILILCTFNCLTLLPAVKGRALKSGGE
jgi:hypothetical protein